MATSNTINTDQIHAAIRATLPNYVEAIHDLPDKREHYYGSHWLSEAEWDEAKEHTIEYNDVFREIIEDNPSMKQEEIMSIVADIANELDYPDDIKEMIRHNTYGILHGMQHEVAFEQILAVLPDEFQVVTTDDEDDAHGADFKVRCPNGVVISIDVKASEHRKEEAEQRLAQYMRRHHKKIPGNEIILFSGFDEFDFTEESPWRASQAAVQRELPHIQAKLLQASEKYAVSSKKLGHVTY